jgi:tripartite-type tricarboxylate transporter receptor subunit TctC
MRVPTMLTRREMIAGAALALPALAPRQAAAQTAEKFYAGRTITLIVPFGPGGYYDIGARLIARHLGDTIPGKPRVIVQNQPSAGGIGLANRFAAGADNDGSVIGVLQRAVPQYGLIGYQSVRFDPLKMNWIGSLSAYASDSYVLIVNAAHKAKTIAELQKGDVKTRLGAGRSGSANLVYALVAKDLFNLNIDLVRGYEGTAPIFLALQRGEVDGLFADFSTIKVALSDMWHKREVVPIVQFGRKTRFHELADVPTARELVTDPVQQKFLTFAELPFFIALPVAAPTGVPADRIQALQAAFMTMAMDQTFVDDSKIMNYAVDPISGEAVLKQIAEASTTPADLLARFKEMVSAA